MCIPTPGVYRAIYLTPEQLATPEQGTPTVLAITTDAAGVTWVEDLTHEATHGQTYLSAVAERPDFWAEVWAVLSERERQLVLARAQAAGATDAQLCQLRCEE